MIRPGVRTAATASPIAEAEAVNRRDTNRNDRPAVFPCTPGTHRATSSVGHRQEILRLKCRRVGGVGRRRNTVRDRAVVAPIAPDVLDVCATALWRCCGNGVT